MWAMHTSCTMTHIHTDAQVQLPLAGRELTDYDCKPTETGNTILSDWSRCKEGWRKSEL